MPIFEITVKQTILVAADDIFYAEQAAQDSIPELDWQNYRVEGGREVLTQEEVGDGWCLECLPYGGDGKTRLKDLLPARAGCGLGR
ncbi:MAG: hypothetical protein RBS34_00410 [Desulfofustis sp.]|nr:hypothetical protein [Desulfofustis sp.]